VIGGDHLKSTAYNIPQQSIVIHFNLNHLKSYMVYGHCRSKLIKEKV